MNFQLHITEDSVVLTPESVGLLGRLLRHKPDLTAPDPGDHALLLALGDLSAVAEESPAEAKVTPDQIELSHGVVSELAPQSATALGLPSLPDLTFQTEAHSVVGNPDFRLSYRWLRDGKVELVNRTGAILHTSHGDRRIPSNILRAINVADKALTAELPNHWNALARFRNELLGADADEVGRIAMTDFLSGLQVHLASRFSIEPKQGNDGWSFDVLVDEVSGGGEIGEAVDPKLLSRSIEDRGALPAYRLGKGSYLVVDEAAQPVLEVIARMQKAPKEEREAFLGNPLRAISEAVEQDLKDKGKLSNLTDADQQRIIDDAMDTFVLPEDYGERVEGIGLYVRPEIDQVGDGRNFHMPEIFGDAIAGKIKAMSIEELQVLRQEVSEALEAGQDEMRVGDSVVQLDPTRLAALDAEILGKQKMQDEILERDADAQGDEGKDVTVPNGQQILKPKENFDTIGFKAPLKPRQASSDDNPPSTLKTPLHDHQKEGLAWTQEAWRAGLAGVLNADEQGLGKTLQTIAFLAWMKEKLAEGCDPNAGPVLVVAPTSLLENWEAEVNRHLEAPGLGSLIRLYGAGTTAYRRAGAAGKDIQDATEHLDLEFIHEAVREDRAHRMWMLTTYQTLTNYQHSLGRIRFSAIVFDEIQALKNPGTLAAMAAKAMNGSFRIGLTGTPVENRVSDLWAIIDQLVPGYFETLKEFRQTYEGSSVDALALQKLHGKVFDSGKPHPPVGIRRLKADAAKDLPEKARYLHPGAMPSAQADAYETARAELVGGGLRGVLKMLHRIRGVSLHPDPGMSEGFEESSARLSAALSILDRVHAAQERALVFIEDRRMQHRFVAIAKARYGLPTIDIINGSTLITKRQDIVDRFQQHKGRRQFDMLVLGPRAAGTGLTLTAATHVIHLSRWWNPAVEEQCNDRIHRIGQDLPVHVHIPLAVHPRYGLGSFDCQLQILMEKKRRLALETLSPGAETSEDVEILRNSVLGEGQPYTTNMDTLVSELFGLMEKPAPEKMSDGSFRL